MFSKSAQEGLKKSLNFAVVCQGAGKLLKRKLYTGAVWFVDSVFKLKSKNQEYYTEILILSKNSELGPDG